ncbi:unnamed protein product [Meganyctiphanes norvegica]|uniref:G-protein coupled receptors family 1 profile domain-containing protein n=1 Tax=Meganyctiphanes norvegica TaxID=48144 RepID=A0AAV2QBP6_MEGNR
MTNYILNIEELMQNISTHEVLPLLPSDDGEMDPIQLTIGLLSNLSSPNSTTSDTGDMDLLHLVTYQVLYPIIICASILANSLCILVVTTPKLRRYHVNPYILLLSVCNLLGALACIPAAFSAGDCIFNNYNMAVYFAHCCWSLVNLTKTLALYVITWMAYDRFIGVWSPLSFHKIEKAGVLPLRIVISLLIGCSAFLPVMINGEVKCSGANCTNEIDNNDTKWMAIDDTKWMAIDDNRWMAIDGYSNEFHAIWHRVFFIFHGLIAYWLPGLLLIFFTGGLSVALAQRKINQYKRHRKSKKFYQTVALLIIAISFILCILPLTIVIIFISGKENSCYVSFEVEVMRSVGSLLQMMWHMGNVGTIFMLNLEYRTELKSSLYALSQGHFKYFNCFEINKEREYAPLYIEMEGRLSPIP